MTENKEILNKLIGSQENEALIPTSESDGAGQKSTITTSRIIGVRYKFYTIILLLLIFIVGYNYILPSYERYESTKIELSDVELELSNFQTKKTKYESNIGLVDTIKNVESQIVNCVNMLEGCQELPDIVKNNFSVVRSYLLLTEMSNNKMSLDEKKILANIDGFLLKRDSLSSDSAISNGVLNKIIIGEKEEFNDNLYFVPIELSIKFSDKDGLMSFIDNVEKKIPVQEELRILYKIDKINYDIVNYDEPQESSIFMYGYFYDDKTK
ncbi:MAG TPA: hypothetical protein PK674_03760 [Candidatus Absconditabacterales bacterium]|nr:hypothetical protein [Candidatus Absconditabacterales bacterium]HOQ79260.1 hypothetical protein [Candidatus Absconditabacterales bacterium]